MSNDLSPDAVREALVQYDSGMGLVLKRYPEMESIQPVSVIVEAARLWLASRSGPSDQEIEAAMLKLVELAQDALKPTPIAVWRDRAKAILVAAFGVEGD